MPTHATGHLHPLEDPGRGGTGADRSRRAVLLVVAVGGALALEIVALHGAGEPLALGHGDGVDPLARAHDLGGELLADLVPTGVVEPELDEVPARLHAGGREMPLLRLVQRRGALDPPGDLQGGVALAFGRLHLHHAQRRDLEDRHRDGAVVLVPDLGHADLLADDRLGRHGWVPSVLVLERPQRRDTPRSSAPSPAPGSHANAPPGSPERSVRQVLPRGPYRTRRKALGDVESAYGPEIGPTCDVTPWSWGPATRNYAPRRGRRAQTFWIFISMSTPAGRSRRCRESTVFGVCSTMSTRRLCTCISKCSRLSLYLCGERITV